MLCALFFSHLLLRFSLAFPLPSTSKTYTGFPSILFSKWSLPFAFWLERGGALNSLPVGSASLSGRSFGWFLHSRPLCLFCDEQLLFKTHNTMGALWGAGFVKSLLRFSGGLLPLGGRLLCQWVAWLVISQSFRSPFRRPTGFCQRPHHPHRF